MQSVLSPHDGGKRPFDHGDSPWIVLGFEQGYGHRELIEYKIDAAGKLLSKRGLSIFVPAVLSPAAVFRFVKTALRGGAVN